MLREFERFDCVVPALITAGGTILGGAIGALATRNATSKTVDAQLKMNAENIAMQRETNKMQMDLAKNAYSYSVADRLRAGLSPLDSQPMSAPQLTAPQGEAPDYSGLGEAGAFFGSQFSQGINNAVQAYQQDRSVSSQVDYNNAQSADALASATGKLIDAQEKIDTYETRIATAEEKLKELKTTNSSLAERLQKQIEESQARINELNDLIKRQNAILPSQINLNNAQTEQAKAVARSNNASAYEQEKTNEWSDTFRVPPSIVNSFDTKSPQSVLLYNAWLSIAEKEKKQSSLDQSDLDSAYRSYKEQWQSARNALSQDIAKYNRSAHSGSSPSGQSWQDYRKELQAREKDIGRKPMTFSQFKKMSGF